MILFTKIQGKVISSFMMDRSTPKGPCEPRGTSVTFHTMASKDICIELDNTSDAEPVHDWDILPCLMFLLYSALKLTFVFGEGYISAESLHSIFKSLQGFRIRGL